MINCLYCSTLTYNKKYCSRQCQLSGKINKIEKTCLNCGNLIYVRKSEVNKKYCSRSCSAQKTHNGKMRKNSFYVKCGFCKKNILTNPSIIEQRKNGIKYCSRECRSNAMSNNLTNYGFKKEYIKLEKNKYIRKQVNGIRKKEHRRIMEEFLGRTLEKWECIHHINNDPKDNRLENLMIVTPSEHAKIHKNKKDL